MILLVAFAFLAGVVTVLSPCILPLLPIILSSSIDISGKKRPLGVVIGFVFSFTFFTLFLSSIVKIIGIPADSLRLFSIVVLIGFGATLLIPHIQLYIEKSFGVFASKINVGTNHYGFWGGLLIGLSLGLLWTPCVGPILASVISLAITGTVTLDSVFITLAYSVGTAVPMFIIMALGSNTLQRVPWLVRNTEHIQRVFGVIMIVTGFAIYFHFDRVVQNYILRTFPNYGANLTKIEEVDLVDKALNKNSTEGSFDITKSKNYGKAPEIISGGKWFNSQEALTIESLRGKVVLIDFWTYSCINCQRTLPYLISWHKKYSEQGLIIIGVHSPEFEFEKAETNVAKALKDFGIEYPVVQDNDFSTWKNYSNKYWPSKYLIDKDGFIRYYHFGEGEYNTTENKIQELLKDTGSNAISRSIENPEYKTYARTPELYLGYERLGYLASTERIIPDKLMTFSFPSRLKDNLFAYKGDWTVTKEYAAPRKNSQLLLNFEAKEVFLVARPKKGNTGLLKVYVDGQMQGFGLDNKNGMVLVESDRLYNLVKLSAPGKHELKIEFKDDNLEIYAFTFG